MPELWHVGMKVVCVQGIYRTPEWDTVITFPEKDKIYTIREIRPSGKRPGKVSFRLKEIINKPRQYKQGFVENCFGEWHFRPLFLNDSGVFEEILAKLPKRVELKEKV